MEEMIDDVKQNIAEKIRWAYPISLKLQEYDYRLAVRWAIECVKIFTFEYESRNFPKLGKYLQQAIEELNKSALTLLREFIKNTNYKTLTCEQF